MLSLSANAVAAITFYTINTREHFEGREGARYVIAWLLLVAIQAGTDT
jgi:hypothetical protein